MLQDKESEQSADAGKVEIGEEGEVIDNGYDKPPHEADDVPK